jgi:hypothetical protein
LRLRNQPSKLDLLILRELGHVPSNTAGAELRFSAHAPPFDL